LPSGPEVLNGEMFDKPLPPAELKTDHRVCRRDECFYRCNEDPLRSLCQREVCVTRKFGIRPEQAEEAEAGNSCPRLRIWFKYITEPVRWELRVDGQLITNIGTPRLAGVADDKADDCGQANPYSADAQAQEWERILQPLMMECRMIEAPDDASVNGVIRARMREFAAKADLFNRGMDPTDRLALLRGLPCVQVNENGTLCGVPKPRFHTYLSAPRVKNFAVLICGFAIKEMGFVPLRCEWEITV